MKLVFLDQATVGNISELELLNQFGEFISYARTEPQLVASRIEGAEIVLTNKVVLDRTILQNATSLKLICVAATGTNNIDLETAKELGIVVKNVKGYSTQSVTQQTFALLFSLLNHIVYYDSLVKNGSYSKGKMFTSLDREIVELSGKTLGIIGMGAIGRNVAHVAKTFGAEVIYYSSSGQNTDQPYKQVSLNELLKLSDIVSIHAPLTDLTKNLIGYDQLNLMKQSAILINTGRGGIVKEDDLIKALNENLLCAAALDVFEKEPIPDNSPLLQLKDASKLVLSPHVAWSSIEARQELMRQTISNIKDFINR